MTYRGLSAALFASLVLATAPGDVPVANSGPNPFAVWGALAIAIIATAIIVGWYLRGRRRRRR